MSLIKLALLAFLISPAFGQIGTVEYQENITLAQSGALNCGIKPIPRIGYVIGRCVNGQWEQVSR